MLHRQDKRLSRFQFFRTRRMPYVSILEQYALSLQIQPKITDQALRQYFSGGEHHMHYVSTSQLF